MQTPRSVEDAQFGDDGLMLTPISKFTTVSANADNSRWFWVSLSTSKSQEATFDRVVFNYHKSQQNQLVYVAMSRVTDLGHEGDYKLYQGAGNTAPTVKEIRDEFARLRQNRLPTNTQRV